MVRAWGVRQLPLQRSSEAAHYICFGNCVAHRRKPVYNRFSLTRGGAVWQLVGLITRRSQVQILPPQPTFASLSSAGYGEAALR
jgi:hypothetical protein